MSTYYSDLSGEFFLDGELVRMDIHDLSQNGFSGDTTAELEPGNELTVRLVGGAADRPVSIEVRVDSILLPANYGVEHQQGFRFRLLRFSQAYALLISGDTETSTGNHPDVERQAQLAHGQDEKEWISSILGAGDEAATKASSQEPAWEDCESLSERAGVPLWSEDNLAPEATVIDDGELDDVIRVLAELGIKTERLSPLDDSFLATWVRPQHLLVVSAKRALTLALPLRSQRRSFVSIAVSDSDSKMVCSRVQRLGYQYVISRPVHPLSMAMLFRQAIFPDQDQRAVPREVLSCFVRWSCGWTLTRPGMLLDLSLAGCQLLVRGNVKKGVRIKLRLPASVTEGRELALTGEVLRASHGNGETTLGIVFDEIADSSRERLQTVLSRPGPYRLMDVPLHLRGPSNGTNPSDIGYDSLDTDRRTHYRAEVRREVVALEHRSSQLKYVLVSSDLTVDGMHVEAHPSMLIGEQMDLALYEESDSDPLILSAVAARDDGRNGWWLRFVGVTPEIHDRLVQTLDRFPPVTRLGSNDSAPERFVLGEMLVYPKPLDGDELD